MYKILGFTVTSQSDSSAQLTTARGALTLLLSLVPTAPSPTPSSLLLIAPASRKSSKKSIIDRISQAGWIEDKNGNFPGQQGGRVFRDRDGHGILLRATGAAEATAGREDLSAGDFSACGRRDSNEDFHIVQIGLPRLPKVTLLAVFDGHGGAGASKFCARKLVPILGKSKAFKTGKYEEALVAAYKKLDERYMDKFEEDGTTAVVAVLAADNTLTVANVGDSRCYIIPPSGAPIAMSEDHKPEQPIERKRIENAGHEVVRETVLQHGKRVHTHRVDGILAVARSIGDANFKDSFEAPPEEQAVCCIPDVKVSKEPVAAGSFLLLACDGLWDVATPEEAADFVREKVAEGTSLTKTAELLSALAIDERGSDDNVTIVIAKVNAAKAA